MYNNENYIWNAIFYFNKDHHFIDRCIHNFIHFYKTFYNNYTHYKNNTTISLLFGPYLFLYTYKDLNYSNTYVINIILSTKSNNNNDE